MRFVSNNIHAIHIVKTIEISIEFEFVYSQLDVYVLQIFSIVCFIQFSNFIVFILKWPNRKYYCFSVENVKVAKIFYRICCYQGTKHMESWRKNQKQNWIMICLQIGHRISWNNSNIGANQIALGKRKEFEFEWAAQRWTV